MATKTLTDKLESSRVLIFNSRDAEVAALLDSMGIDTAYIDEGEALYNETMTLVDQQKKEYQEQSLAYDTFYVEKDTAEANYQRTLKLVKVTTLVFHTHLSSTQALPKPRMSKECVSRLPPARIFSLPLKKTLSPTHSSQSYINITQAII